MTRWTDADAADTDRIIEAWVVEDPVAEIGWVAHEALALALEHEGADTDRWAEYMARKRALLAHIEADRATR